MDVPTAPLEVWEIKEVFQSWLPSLTENEQLLNLWNVLFADLRTKAESKYAKSNDNGSSATES